MKRLAYLIRGLLMAAALLGLAGCLFNPPETKPTAELPDIENTTPANVLRNIERAYNQKDYQLYKKCLAPSYVFYFNPQDVGYVIGEYTIPVSWNQVEDLDAARAMFNEAYSIMMDIPAENIKDPEQGETTFRTGQVEMQLTLLTAPGTGYMIGAGYCIFEFERYYENGNPLWRMTKWWDYTHD